MAYRNFIQIVRQRSAEEPGRLAYSFLADGENAEARISYRELDAKARAVAVHLQRANVAPGERCLLLYPPGLDYIAGFLGCLYAGVIAVPAYPPHASGKDRSLQRLKGIARDATPVAALTVSQLQTTVRKLIADVDEFRDVNMLTTDRIDQGQANDWRSPAIDESTLAFLQYTSGSTGSPKGVMVSHGNLLHNSASIRDAFGLSTESKVVSWLPPYHDMGLIGGILQPLYTGFPCILMPPVSFLQRPLRWLQAISTHKATISGGPNFAYDLCISKVTAEQRARLDLSSWVVAFNGSEPLRPETLERFVETFASCGFRREAFFPCYGLAESTLLVSAKGARGSYSTQCIDAAALGRNEVVGTVDTSKGKLTLVSCGATANEQVVRIVDPETQSPCEPNRVGEIWTSGPSIAHGYWNNPEHSEATFRAKAAGSVEANFLRTGDLGFLSNGELYVTGRLKDLIIIRGVNHYPQDLEATVERCHPALRPAGTAAFSVLVSGEEKLVIAQELQREYCKADPTIISAVIDAVRHALAEHHELELHALILLKPGALPKTSSGKIQRRACREGFLRGTFDVVAEWGKLKSVPLAKGDCRGAKRPAGGRSQREVEDWLCLRLASRLNLPPSEIRVDQPFSRYGLDSLGAVAISGELEEWLGQRLSPTLAWEFPNIQLLARYLAGDSESRVQEQIAAVNEPIAIIGIGCRFPGAKDTEAFWQLLRNGIDGITEVPADRWDVAPYYDPDPATPGKMNTRWGGFLQDVDLFDPQFFGITPREALRMDPQQRLLMEVAWEALEDAGQVPEKLAESRTGVFIGISTNDYGRKQLDDLSLSDTYSATGSALSIAANRLSYFLNVRGPSMAVDTACSSSLVAVHLACCSLWRGESIAAIAGGVNLTISPTITVNLSKSGFLSPDGHCKAFDARANGYVRGEGAGAVILKPLSKATADGDSIYAVIRGTAINQDGRSNGITAPNPQAQEAVLEEAYRQAGISPGQVQYVEAHGTGTFLGDPIEAAALAKIISRDRAQGEICALGSVKSNIGHLEAAAGIAGLIKVALALKHREVPQSLHFEKSNPHIPFDEIPLRVQQHTGPWPNPDRSLIAGVSSFGFGGTNAHAVLEEGPAWDQSTRLVSDPLPVASLQRLSPFVRGTLAPLTSQARLQQESSVPLTKGDSRWSEATGRGSLTSRAELFLLSGHNAKALEEVAAKYAAMLSTNASPNLHDICFTAAARRTHHEHRLSIVASTREQLIEELKSFVDQQSSGSFVTGRAIFGRQPKVVFVFSGHGSQYWGMARELMQQEPVFRETIQTCDELLQRHAGWSLLTELEAPESESRFSTIDIGHPVLFSLQVAFAHLWQSWGVVPAGVVGHSMGEVAAACFAGALSLEEAMRLIILRSQSMEPAVGKGRMAVVELSPAQAESAITDYRDRLFVAVHNGPTSTVLSGDPVALNEVLSGFEQKGVFCRAVQVDVAAHSPHMDGPSEELRKRLDALQSDRTKIPMFSTVTGSREDGLLDADYWSRNLRSPVLFATATANMIADGFNVFVEISPHSILSVPLAQSATAAATTISVLPTLTRGRPDRETILRSAGSLHVLGQPVNWQGLFVEGGRTVALPTYAWQRERYWIEDSASQHAIATTVRAAETHEALHDWFYDIEWRPKPLNATHKHSSTALPWLIFADNRGVGAELAQQLTALGELCSLVRRGEAADINDLSCKGIVHLWSLDAPSGEITVSEMEQTQEYTSENVLAIIKSAASSTQGTPQFWLATCGSQAIVSSNAISVAQAPLWGLARVLSAEHPEIWKGVIDLDPAASASQSASQLCAEILRGDGEDQLAYRGMDRYAARLVPQSRAKKHSAQHFNPNGAYLVTGGFGDLGLLVAKWMVERGARRLILMGRTPVPPRSEWLQMEAGTNSARRVAAVRELEALGAHVHVAAIDVGDENQLTGFLDEYRRECWPPIRGVVHAAGVDEGQPLLELDVVQLRKLLRAKMNGGWLLHQLLQNEPLDFFVLFSSAATVFASPFLGAYTAANRSLDALAHHRRSLGQPALSINWGFWAEGGMAARYANAFGRELTPRGMGGITPAQGMRALEQVVSTDAAQVCIMPIQWPEWSQFHPLASQSPLFAEIVGRKEGQEDAKQKATLSRETVVAAAPEKRRELIETYLRNHVSRVTGIAPHKLDLEQPLVRLGLDSLMAVELKKCIELDLGANLATVTFLKGPGIAQLTSELLDALGSQISHGPWSMAHEIEQSPNRLTDHSNLSFSQRWFWSLQQLNVENPWCCIPTVFRFSGRLDVQALRQSINEIVRRHEALRTRFPVVDGQPVQEILPDLTVELPLYDLSAMSRDEQEAEARRIAIEESQRAFDLTEGPLVRSCLLRFGADDHLWVMTLHHCIGDEWSREIFLRELEPIYRAYSSGAASPLEKIGTHYRHFEQWQRHWLQGEEAQKQLQYWAQQLAGTPVLEFPVDHPRSRDQEYCGAIEHHSVPKDLYGPLKDLSRSQGCTLYMTMMAAFKALLHRYTGQDDIAVGSFAMTRSRPETKALFGCLVNSLVFRTSLAGNPSFRELLGRVRKVSLEAYAHQDVPFEMLLDALQVRRDSMRTPLFQVVLAHDRNLEIDLAGLTARYLYLDHIRSNFDFALRIREDSEGLNLLLEYNTRLFEVATIRRLLKAFETMLTGIVASPDQKLMDFPLLSEAERRQLLGDWETREAEEVARKKLQSVRRKLAPVGRPQTK